MFSYKFFIIVSKNTPQIFSSRFLFGLHFLNQNKMIFIKKNKMEDSKTLLFGLIEKKIQSKVHDKVELNVSDYPELDGLSDTEITYYITENCHNMKSFKPEYESLWHELINQKIVIEKTIEEKQQVYKNES